MKALFIALISIGLVFTGFCVWMLHSIEQEAIMKTSTSKDTTAHGNVSCLFFGYRKITTYNRAGDIIKTRYIADWDEPLFKRIKIPQ